MVILFLFFLRVLSVIIRRMMSIIDFELLTLQMDRFGETRVVHINIHLLVVIKCIVSSEVNVRWFDLMSVYFDLW